MESKSKEQLMNEVNVKLAELNAKEDIISQIKNNRTEFLSGKDLYRVHKPNSIEKDEVNDKQMEKYVQFLQNPNYLFREQHITLLKTKGIDILHLEAESLRLHNTEKDLLKRLALVTMKDDIDNLKNEIIAVRLQAQDIFFEKEKHLKYCIEKQLEDFVRYYLLFLVLEVKKGDTWQRVYTNYDTYEKTTGDELIMGRAAQLLAGLVYSDEL